jgi:dienelactone hydrolase
MARIQTAALLPLVLILPLAAHAQSQTIELPFTSHDGHPMLGKLTIPSGGGRYPVLIYVQTAEGATVDMKRPNGRGGTFNYYDLYREKLPAMGVAFFSYEGRGIRMGDQPPRYEHIDWDVYNTSSLDNKVRDILTAVRLMKKQKSIDTSRVLLMGASEGTLLAVEAASRAPEEIHGLALYAVLSSTLKDALKFMAADGNFMVLRSFFDTDKDGRISKQEFAQDPRKLRERAMKNVTFDQFDRDGDGVFTSAEMRLLRKPILDGIDIPKTST